MLKVRKASVIMWHSPLVMNILRRLQTGFDSIIAWSIESSWFPLNLVSWQGCPLFVYQEAGTWCVLPGAQVSKTRPDNGRCLKSHLRQCRILVLDAFLVIPLIPFPDFRRLRDLIQTSVPFTCFVFFLYSIFFEKKKVKEFGVWPSLYLNILTSLTPHFFLTPRVYLVLPLNKASQEPGREGRRGEALPVGSKVSSLTRGGKLPRGFSAVLIWDDLCGEAGDYTW